MKISVVIPVLDEAGLLGRRLAELDRCGFDEVIVVDGGSTDATRDIALGHPRVVLIDAARGRSRQMNAGARRATGDAILFLHADVSLPGDALAHVRDAFSTPGTVAGAFRTWTVAVDHDRRPWWRPLLHLADLRSRTSRLPYGDQALFVLRDVFFDVGGFPDIPLMEDLELSRTLSTRGRIRIVRSRVRVSGRRFLERPLYYTVLVNVIPLLHRMGVPPDDLGRLYGNPRGRTGVPRPANAVKAEVARSFDDPMR